MGATRQKQQAYKERTGAQRAHRRAAEKEKVRFAVGTSYYNDRACIPRFVKSLIADGRLQPDLLITVDGRYRGYPDADEYSIDGSAEVFARLKMDFWWQVQNYKMADFDERTKRQAYVNIAAREGMDFLLIMDSDEFVAYPETDWNAFRQELEMIKRYSCKDHNVYGIRCVDLHQQGYAGFRPRLWYRPGEMHYTNTHYYFKRRDSKDTATGYIHRNVENLTIFHDHTPRSQQREELRKEYRLLLPKLES